MILAESSIRGLYQNYWVRRFAFFPKIVRIVNYDPGFPEDAVGSAVIYLPRVFGVDPYTLVPEFNNKVEYPRARLFG